MRPNGATDGCPYCSLKASDQKVVFRNDLVWFVRDRQEVFHAHLHVIPRFRQEPMAGQGIRSHLKSEANRW